MGFIKIVDKECVCEIPDQYKYGFGTIWQCDNCKKKYIIMRSEYGKIWEPYLTSMYYPTYK